MEEIKSSIFGLNDLKEVKKEEASLQLLNNLLQKYREELMLKGKAGVFAYGTFIGYKGF